MNRKTQLGFAIVAVITLAIGLGMSAAQACGLKSRKHAKRAAHAGSATPASGPVSSSVVG